MVLDTSALIAILSGEPEQEAFIHAIERADVRLLSAATLLEASIVIEARYGAAGAHHLDRLLERADVEIVPVDGEQASAARSAWQRFGKGRHPAALNFGDCFPYANLAAGNSSRKPRPPHDRPGSGAGRGGNYRPISCRTAPNRKTTLVRR